MRPRAVVGASVAAGTAQAQARAAPIGTAWMQPEGCDVRDVVAPNRAKVGQVRLADPPGHPYRATVLHHLGGLCPGEVKPVPPFT
ncbi:hypothetical protein [Roseomonas fluvialis]|uniref:Uncharacterized protein n=1 Tax=Roseomonas fluvialis TaxID=1750527 RepID=A0ABN6NXP2_9PROT|nr:hypothetical protein [Roseomonas fluvialis]BDG71170.1 hypothetical protein Rmf_10990 [Roseomonas fluvialis]